MQPIYSSSSAQCNTPRAVTLMEMLVAMALVTMLILANLRVLNNAKSINRREERLTELTLAANTQLGRLRATPWKELQLGESALSLEHLQTLALDGDLEKYQCTVIVQERGEGLVEMQVVLHRETLHGPIKAEISTWRRRMPL